MRRLRPFLFAAKVAAAAGFIVGAIVSYLIGAPAGRTTAFVVGYHIGSFLAVAAMAGAAAFVLATIAALVWNAVVGDRPPPMNPDVFA
ncbi:MAG: hypothetical protein ACHP7N_17600 [Caulobacterales bacterium]